MPNYGGDLAVHQSECDSFLSVNGFELPPFFDSIFEISKVMGLSKLMMFKEILNSSCFWLEKNPKNFELEKCLIQAKRFK